MRNTVKSFPFVISIFITLMFSTGCNPDIKGINSSIELGMYDQAINKINRELENHDQNSELYHLLGICHLGLYSVQESKNTSKSKEFLINARSSFEAALKLEPSKAKSHYLLGICQLETGLYSKGIESLKMAMQLKPDWSPPLETLCKVIREEEERDQYIQNLLSISPFQDWAPISLPKEDKKKALKAVVVVAKEISLASVEDPKDKKTFNQLDALPFYKKEDNQYFFYDDEYITRYGYMNCGWGMGMGKDVIYTKGSMYWPGGSMRNGNERKYRVNMNRVPKWGIVDVPSQALGGGKVRYQYRTNRTVRGINHQDGLLSVGQPDKIKKRIRSLLENHHLTPEDIIHIYRVNIAKGLPKEALIAIGESTDFIVIGFLNESNRKTVYTDEGIIDTYTWKGNELVLRNDRVLSWKWGLPEIRE